MKKFYYKLGLGSRYTFGEIYAKTLEEASEEIQGSAVSMGEKFSVISASFCEKEPEEYLKWREKEL